MLAVPAVADSLAFIEVLICAPPAPPVEPAGLGPPAPPAPPPPPEAESCDGPGPGLELPPLLPCGGLTGGVLPDPPATALLPPPPPPPDPPLTPTDTGFPEPPPPPPADVIVLKTEFEPTLPFAELG